MSRRDETKEARRELGKAVGRVHITANDTGLAGPVVGGAEEHGRVVSPYGENLFAAFQCGQDLRELWLRSAANDKGVSLAENFGKLGVLVHRVGEACRWLRQVALKAVR